MKAGDRLPRFVAGEWRTPPEDIGGVPGFEMFLEAITDPDHEEHNTLMDWYGRPFDPKDTDEDLIRIQMGRLANMRTPKR